MKIEKLKIAIQKSGRLHEESIKILEECGINLPLNLNKDKLKISLENFDIFFIRDDDITDFVYSGIADIGIVGKNVVFEQGKNSLIKDHLGFGYCRLSLAVPKESIFKSLKDLLEKRIATSHPNILNKYLKKQNLYSYIHKISGSVEIAPNIGVSDAILDLVNSGRTLDSNNLKEIEPIFISEAVLICNPNSNLLAKKLLSRLQDVKRSRNNKYLFFNVPNNKLEKILLSLKKAKNLHILPIANSEWTYVQVIVPDFILWTILDSLKRNSVKDFVLLESRKKNKN